MKKSSGMTLIEMIIAIVLMGIAMVAFTSFLVPQVRDSAIPHYQTRAAALGQGFMSQILARGFDENSDFDGGTVRCGENGVSCTDVKKLGADKKLDGSLETTPSDFNDVDDYIGCWSTSTTASQCDGIPRGNISDVLGANSTEQYKNFRLEVSVAYDDLTDKAPDEITEYKKVTLRIFAGNTQPLTLTAIKGNY
ncbi:MULTISPECIES: type II secretion system protein [Vibrio diabolicus subgroup]|uniref:type II secretion system protein n=1 Tax=Vibrio diabolicus subgroup TaxID=2315253 RepID=UPI00215FC993|nr:MULTISPECIES: type II secretion system protein [Vibrio diabolicus subgroup]MCR9967264.1 type II secretion system GspH family protein [Vibrio antiquarius]MCS0346009.1 type II secretion system GspH family protein [Vibrio diabolicus]MCS0358690.1 type II secretion system GspH family protein [Vibrio diabolicus]MCS0372952.1 type II secretion system GspH family protein [Vibrio diabolicus]MCS0425801.1 type II secretion system GspH family protein [Vibrio diabolicus]